MKKLLIILFYSFLSLSFSFSQSIPLSLSKPVNVGACTLNSYVAHFPGTGAVQRISIQSSVLLNGINAPFCGTSNGSLVVVDRVRKDGDLNCATG